LLFVQPSLGLIVPLWIEIAQFRFSPIGSRALQTPFFGGAEALCKKKSLQISSHFLCCVCEPLSPDKPVIAIYNPRVGEDNFGARKEI
jgi:hypothetical protein